jgi:hypothetical protein
MLSRKIRRQDADVAILVRRVRDAKACAPNWAPASSSAVVPG